MKEDYVDFECAKMLVELDYPQKIMKIFGFNYYNGEGKFNGNVIRDLINGTKTSISAPTLYQAQKFLREKYSKFITVEDDKEWGKYSAIVKTKVEALNGSALYLDGFTIFNTPEQALLEGIKETCKYLLDGK
jgi:hypothetical protein